MMIRTVLLSSILLTACATGDGFMPAGEHIGEPMQERQIETLAEVHAAPDAHFEKTLLVEAKITAVCQSKGCWMQVEDAGGVTSMVRWESGCGGKYAFPKDAIGERVLIQGSFYPKEIAKADKEHIESESGGGVVIKEKTFEMNASAVVMLDRTTE